MSGTTGQFLSGERLAAESATLECPDGAHLRVSTASSSREYPLAALRVSDRLGSVARFIYLPDRGVVETLDNGAIDRWFAHARRNRFAELIHFLESHRGVAALACVLVLAMLGLGFYFGPPKLARSVAHRVPRQIDEAAGKAALASINTFFPQSTLRPSERKRVDDQLTRVLGPNPATRRPKLEFRTMGASPNAFALPGGTIVVADELVRLPATDDELAAVLAHEVGHLQHRHGLQTVLRGSFALLFVSAATGDLSVLTSFAATLPLSVLQNGYARDLEREADAYALTILDARGIPAKSFSTALFKLQHAAGRNEQPIGYLSTHPDDAERMAMFGTLTAGDRERIRAALVASEAAPSPQDRIRTPAEPPTATLATFEQRSWPTPNHAVEEPPRPLRRPRPTYPMSARRAQLSGEVLVNFIVEPDGTVANPYVVKSTNPVFDAAAVDAVSTWNFIPGKTGGDAVRVHMKVPIVFQLAESPE